MMLGRDQKAVQRNPFVVGGLVSGEHFADRESEVQRMMAALLEPQAKLLVYGPRRMGKSSAIEVAITQVSRQDGFACRADLSGATTLADVASRILHAASRVIGRRWRDALTDFISRLQFGFSVTSDPATGVPLPTVSVQQRTEPLTEQRAMLDRVLHTIDQVTGERGITLGLALDEFQELQRFGGAPTEWHLRGLMERTRNLAFVAAGSQESLIRTMVGERRAFYRFFEQLHFGPIADDQFAEWIEERMAARGIAAAGCGGLIIAAAGPRTWDVVHLARATFNRALETGAADRTTIEEAFRQIVLEESESFRVRWEGLGGAQQNLLRAIAAGERQLHSREVRKQYGLKSTAEVAQAIKYLEKNELISETTGEYRLDNPFFRGWIRLWTLPDVGLMLPIL